LTARLDGVSIATLADQSAHRRKHPTCLTDGIINTERIEG
jgi:hypothetical protein